MSTLVPDVCRRIQAGFPDGSPNLPAIDGTRALEAFDYYIDFNAGNDSNNGLTPATALATWNGFEIILGRVCGAPNGCIVHIIDGQNAVDDPVNVLAVINSGSNFRIVNEVPFTQIDSAAVLSFTANAGNVSSQLDCGVGFNANAASQPNIRLRINGGPRDGAIAYVGSLGPASAYVTTNTFLQSDTAINAAPTAVTPQAGDIIVAEVSGCVLSIGAFSSVQNAGGVAGIPAVISIENFELSLNDFHVGASQVQLLVYQCTIEPGGSNFMAIDTGATVTLRNCELPRISLQPISDVRSFFSCAVEGGLCRNGKVVCAGGSLAFSLGTLYEYGGGSTGGIIVTKGGSLVADSLLIQNASDGITDNSLSVMTGSIAVLSNVGGTGNAGLGLYVDDASCAYIADPANMTVTGTAGDFQLGSTPNARTFIESTDSYSAPIAQTWINLALAPPAGFGGSAINVRTQAQIQPGGTGVVPAFLPSSIALNTLWLRADLGISIGLGVSAWADQSGVGNNYIQPTGTKQGVLNPNGVAGQPSVDFDGIDDLMSCVSLLSAFISATEATVIVVMQPVSLNTNNGTVYFNQSAGWGSFSANYGHYLRTTPDATVQNFGAGEALSEATGIAAGTDVMIKSRHSGGQLFFQTNDNPETSIASSPTTLTDITNLAAGYTEAYFSEIRIAEVIAFKNGSLSVSDEAALMNYLQARYNLW